VIKKGNHLEQILITVGLVLILHTLSACSDAISQGNKNEKEINIVQEQDTITEQDNSSNLNTNIKPGTSATMKPDRPIISSVTANPDISSIEPDDNKEATEKEQSNRFDMLAWFTVHEGYIENFIRGSSPDDSVKQKLIWNGNTLTKESEEH